MSGGVDSSAAALIMKEKGFNCEGATMLLFRNADIGREDLRTCCSQKDVDDAASVAFSMDMPYRVLDFTEEFRKYVIDNFAEAYESGLTPNPCIECNKRMKFDLLLEYALDNGFDYLVTGHYARIARREDGRYVLKKALDPGKDQSYVLYGLTQEQLAHVMFPLGDLTKESVRRLASEHGFVNSNKPDSQDICFVPGGDYGAFLESYTGKKYPPGEYLDADGRVVGRHEGAVRYTIGQRKGLRLALGRPVYVCAKDMTKNTVTVGDEKLLFSDTLTARDVNWVSVPGETEPFRCSAKARYRQKDRPGTAYPLGGRRLKFVFDEPQRAITPGQSVVLYDGDVVLAGGIIE
ncbi:MAG: tRNA 2-thiouridine(34) synthase MnmA [Clostridia bacterium]|nr:tRNA 2-thiouridine(34) synthase MnmA [Clostridia bacterium]